MAQSCHFQTIRSFLKTSKLYFENNNLKIMTNFSIASPSFSGGEEIPKKFGYKFENKNPEIDFENVPKNAKSLALIMDDPDAMGAVGKVWVHWVIWNIDPTSTDMLYSKKFGGYMISETDNTSNPEGNLNAAQGMTDFGKSGYGGPAPPDKRHTYVFKLYALDCTLDLPVETHVEGQGWMSSSTKADVEKAMEGHILDQATLKGTYAP